MNARILAVVLSSITLAACNCGGGGLPDGGDPAVATRLAFAVQPSNAQAGENLAPAIQVVVQDDEGQTVSTADGPITLALGANPGAATLGGTLTADVVAGVATFSSLSLQKAAAGYTLTASATGLTGAASAAFDISAAAPSRLSYAVQPSELEAGGVISPSVDVRIEDAFGNLTSSAAAVSIALEPNANGAALLGNTTVNAVAGVASFNELSIDVAGDGYSLTATSPSTSPATSAAFKVRPGTPTTLAFLTEPSNAIAGSAISPAVQVQLLDRKGNRARNAADMVTVSLATNPGGGALGGTLSVAAVDGVATFPELVIVRAAAGYSLTATSGTLTEATSALFNVSAGAVSNVAFRVQPSDTGALSSINPPVEVALLDAFGNTTASTEAVSISLATSPAGAVLTGTTTRNAVGGVATFDDLQVDLEGSYTLEASAPVGTARSTAFSVAHGAATALVFSQQPTSTTSGSAISPAVTVTVLDASGNVATSYNLPVSIALEANAFGGVLAGTTTATPVNGVATFAGLSIARAGTGYQLSASAGALPPSSSATFAISAGSAAALSFATGPSDVSAGAAMPTVRVAIVDANGNVTASTANVALSLNASNGATLSGGGAVAASSGVASFAALSVAKAGTGYTLTAASGGLTPVTSGAFAVDAAAATTLVFADQPQDTLLGEPLPAVRVTARDAHGNDAVSATGNITLAFANNPSAATLGGVTTQALTAGTATFSGLTVSAAGAGYTVTASHASLPSVTSAAFDVTTGPPAQLVFSVQPSSSTAGQAIAPAVEVTVKDANGNTVVTYSGTISLALGAGSPAGALSGTTSKAATNGVASFSDLSIAQAGSGYSLEASGAGAPSATSSAFNVSVGAASQLVFTQQPTHTDAGAVISPSVQVTVRDAAGNTVTSAAGNVVLAVGTGPSGSSLSGTTTAALSSGVATFADLSIAKAGSYTLSASYSTLGVAASSSFDIRVGQATQLVFTTEPSNTTAGAAFSPAVAVAVRDASGNTVTSFSGPISLAVTGGSGSATLTGTSTVTASAGAATFNGLSVTLAGTGYRLSATSGSLGGLSASFDIQAASANRVAIRQQPTSTTAGAPITPAVIAEIQDAYGNLVTAPRTVSVALANNPTGALLSGTLSKATASGVATFDNLAIDRTGSGYTLQLTATALTPAISSGFDIGVGSASRLAFVQQPGSTSAGSSLGTVTVAVQDAAGNVITGSTVSIALALTSTNGATLNGTTPQQAVNGVASFGDLSVNLAGTGYGLTASASGLSPANSAAFSISAAGAAQMVFAQQPSNIVAGAAFAPSIGVRFQDAFGNPTSTATSVTLTFANDPTGTASFIGTASATSASGLATFNGLSVDRAGTGFTVRATSAVGSPITSSAFDVSPAAAAALAVRQQPSQTEAGAAITPAVQFAVVDAYGNTVTSSTASIAVALQANSAGGTLSGTLAGTATSGVAAFSNLRINRAGAGYTLRATSTGLTPVDTSAFAIIPGSAAALRFSQQPSQSQVGVAISPAVTVTVEDASGNVVTTPAVQVALALGNNPSGASLSGGGAQTTSAGVATFSNLALSAAGTGYTLVASSGALPTVTSSAFNVNAVATSGLVYTNPAAGGKIRLVLNAALSTPGTVVLDLIAEQALTGYAVGFNLPLDTTRVVANATLMQTGTALNPGSAPAAMMASIPTTGPLSGVLVTGQSQKASGTGAITTNSTVSAGSVFYRVRLDARAGATPGVVFDGASLGSQFLGLMRDKAGTDVAANADFKIGRLEFL